jgi:hypothetical protein
MRQDHGPRTRVDVSTRHDGKTDKWETYDGGHLVSIAFDSTQRGTPDRLLIYGANGVARLEVDPKGTGQFAP